MVEATSSWDVLLERGWAAVRPPIMILTSEHDLLVAEYADLAGPFPEVAIDGPPLLEVWNSRAGGLLQHAFGKKVVRGAPKLEWRRRVPTCSRVYCGDDF